MTFAVENGEPMAYLQPIDSLGVNGVHAVVVAPDLVRIEVFRAGRTYQLLITKHDPGQRDNGRRPPLESTILFRGVNGFLDLEPSEVDQALGEPPLPRFWLKTGEAVEIPAAFLAAVREAAKRARCVACSHAHYLVAPTTEPCRAL